MNRAVLNHAKHRHLQVVTTRGAEYGENVHLVPVIAGELRSLVLEYPVCLIKNSDTGQFGLHVLLGFEPGQNLYLKGAQWSAHYEPLHVRRQPFSIGRSSEATGAENEGVVCIDLDSPRVQTNSGEQLFNDDGSSTPFLHQMHALLQTLSTGIEATNRFVEAMAAADLIEPAEVKVSFNSGEQRRLEGIYTFDERKLRALPHELLEELNTKGYLEAAYLTISSLGHIRTLVTRL